MAPKVSDLILILSIILFSATTISAFNITYLLDNHPEFSTFNELLTKTGVAIAINNRKTITVLVVDNGGMGSMSGKSESTIRNILATHVLLDYYDSNKLRNMKKKTALVTNLFQSTGKATNQQGYLNITSRNGEYVFGSAVRGAQRNAKVVKSVAAQPFNIAVLQLSQTIETPGIDQTATGPISSPKTPHAPPPKKVKAPAPAPGPDADGPAADDEGADSPSESEAPAPSSPTPAPAPGPDLAPDEEVADDEPKAKLAPPKNEGARITVGGAMVAAFMGLIALAH